MIRRLKRKFIALSMVSLLVLLAAVVAGMNGINYASVMEETDEVLDVLSYNKGIFPGMDDKNNGPGKLPEHMSPELPYESRYFSVLLAADGTVIQTNTSRIASIDSGDAVQYAAAAVAEDAERGFIGKFRYTRQEELLGFRIIFLDCSRTFRSLQTFLWSSVLMALVGYAATFAVIVFLSGRIIRPVAESYEKQKRFITDAGHEIKTPLTVIKAYVDLGEMELGEQEHLSEIRRQAQRLTDLTNDLVYLAKMEEAENTVRMVDFPVSDTVTEAAAPFQAPAQLRGQTLVCRIQPMLSLHGDEKAIGQLVAILLDNAVKYSPEQAEIQLSLSRQGRQVVLSVTNPTADPIHPESLPLLFERFYRTDPSRNSQTGGHGIGLSIARAIAAAHGARIQAAAEDSHTLKITAAFPA